MQGITSIPRIGAVLVLAAGVAAGGLFWTHGRRIEPAAPFTGSTMGTAYRVLIADPLTAQARSKWNARIARCLADVDMRMSTFRPDSEISRFNRSRLTEWFPVSRETAEVVVASLQVARQTGGAFDITVAPLVDLWHFGPDRSPAGVPSDAAIQAALARVGYEHLAVRIAPPALKKDRGDLEVDLSGIAKGFAVDQVARRLEEGGVRAYMIEVGGEVRVRGRKADGRRWRIGIERPVSEERSIGWVLELEETSLATSGDYRNFFRWQGVTYSHAIDPRSGRPIRNGPASVSVVCRETMWADAYATALMVLPPRRSWQLVQSLGIDVLIVQRRGRRFDERMTGGFAARIAGEAPKAE